MRPAGRGRTLHNMRTLLSWRRVILPCVLLVVALVLVAVPRASVIEARARAMLTPSGQITDITIPKIDLDSRVLEVGKVKAEGKTTWEVADYAVGHHEGSGVPGGGTNIVLSGHNNINGAVFRRLDELERGDLISLRTRDGGTHEYEITSVKIVHEDGASSAQRRRNAQYIQPTAHERLTLVSCWPYKSWPEYRILVLADPR